MILALLILLCSNGWSNRLASKPLQFSEPLSVEGAGRYSRTCQLTVEFAVRFLDAPGFADSTGWSFRHVSRYFSRSLARA
jgi:hypothetical protein